jgi:hypothetical protein
MILVLKSLMGFGNLEYKNMATRNGRGNEGIPNTPLIDI